MLSLFSGAGLGDLGWMMAGFEIAGQCEIDEYCQKVLALRFPESVKYKDIRGLTGEKIKKDIGAVDIVAGGFPCQPFSVAGKQRGDQDDRNLWPEMFRVIKEVRPALVVGENVSGIIPIYLDTILADLESEGYAARTFVFPAHALGASHRRERIWIVGYAECNGRNNSTKRRGLEAINDKRRLHEFERHGSPSTFISKDVANAGQQYGQSNSERVEPNSSKRSAGVIHTKSSCEGQSLANSARKRPQRERTEQNGKEQVGLCCGEAEWEKARRAAESRVCRITNVRANRVDRLKALGNGQVVACTAFIGSRIMEFEEKLTTPKQMSTERSEK